MTTPTIAEMLKYADLQMAAEALYNFKAKTDPNQAPGDVNSLTGHYSNQALTVEILTTGNEHASRFTQPQADAFVKQWTVVDHISNTTTGFSGTLFQAIKDDPAQGIKAGQYVLSIRSTEFIDDAVRDSYGTNKLEVKDHGWAFGQISDMEAWYAKLRADGTLPAGAKLDVTGYSLGGHLATAFNLLRREEAALETQSVTIGQVVTFNAAGVGQIKNGASLTSVITLFKDLRASDALIESKFSDRRLAEAYQVLRQRLSDGHTPGVADYDLVNSISNIAPLPADNERFRAEQNWLISALDNIKALKDEVAYTAALNDTKEGQPAAIPETHIAQEGFDYQVAMQIASAMTYSKGAVPSIYNSVAGKSYATPALTNQYDIVGREKTTIQTALVSDSQWHYGKNVDLFIEDQPPTRGGVSLQLAEAYWDTGALHPLQQYSQNDFGDTHSLVLIVDSLNIQNTLQTLDPTVSTDTLQDIFKAASILVADSDAGQGKAEGDVLERVLESLVQILSGENPKLRNGKAENGSSLESGGTWADKTLRQTFYEQLEQVQKIIADNELAGQFTVTIPEAGTLSTTARTDFASLLTLLTLSPFALRATAGAESLVETILADAWPSEYKDWQDDQTLSSAELAQGQGNFTSLFIHDRARFLGWLSQANTKNETAISDGGPDQWVAEERNFQGASEFLPLSLDINGGGDARKMIFGKDTGPDDLAGGAKDDRLYGMGGDDKIAGNDGDDYIEGNSGNDQIEGGLGNDMLLGGKGNDVLKGEQGADYIEGNAGNDTLKGGEGNDILKGGDGTDTYEFTENYGIDIVTDSNAGGVLKVDDQTLNGGAQTFENVYKNETSGQIFVKLNDNNSLVILKSDNKNRIVVSDWSGNNSLGINLQDVVAEAPSVTFAGDFKKAIDGNGGYVMAGDNYAAAGTEVNALDLISGSGGNDVIAGLGGDDSLSGMGGDDYIDGGLGNDQIQGGLGKDRIYGGVGDDVIYGSSDLDIIKPRSSDFTRPVNSYPHPQATGFNWTAGYYSTFGNGVPDSYTDAPRNRLDGDQGNTIDGGDGDDSIAAGTGADFVHGGADKDSIFGMDKDDILFGDGGNDFIYGDGDMPVNSVVWALPENHGNDVIDGGEGNDYLLGQGGSDIIFGGKGEDLIWGDDEEKVALPSGVQGDDFLFGGADKDQLVGGGGNDYLDGGTGDDQIFGDSGDDTLIGGAGDDDLSGGSGKDTYVFNVGDGADTVYDTLSDNNVFRFGAGVEKDKVVLRLGSLMLDLGNGDAVHIADFDQNDVFNSSSIGSFEFSDGSTLSTIELLARGFDLEGTADAEAIIGTNTVDRITGKGGTDYLNGGAGDDVYSFQTGDSPLQDGKITEVIEELSGNDTVRFDGIDVSKLHLRTSDAGKVLLINYGPADLLAIKGGVAGAIEYFEVAGERLTVSEFIGRHSATALTVADDNGNQFIRGGQANDWLGGNGGNDTLSGGRGNDYMSGGEGDDIYHYAFNDGFDSVAEPGYGQGGVDTLEFGAGILPENVSLFRHANDLVVVIDGSANQVWIRNFYTNENYQIEKIRFADATEWGIADLAARTFVGTPNALVGSQGNDELIVDSTFDTVVENNNEGLDTVRSSVTWTLGDNVENLELTGVLNIDATGNSSDNLIVGNLNNNSLNGGDGIDTLFGGAGDDVLNGGNGADTLVGGVGDDVYYSDDGDEVVELPGEGIDTQVSRYGFTLAANVENGRVSTQGPWSAYKSTFYGNALDNLIEVREGDIADGREGADTIVFSDRGMGNPVHYYPTRETSGSTIYVDNLGDKVIFSDATEAEQARIITSIDRVLDQGVGMLELASGSSARTGTGNNLNNLIQGNESENTLLGAEGNDTLFGGAGADTLLGGKGNDTYYLDSRRTLLNRDLSYLSVYSVGYLAPNEDAIVEMAGEGVDTIYTPYDLQLPDNVENLVLETYDAPGSWGSYSFEYALRGTGNSLDNQITGNAGDNVLDGGAGADLLDGKTGNDTYIIDNVGDVIIDSGGVDTVVSSVSYSLSSDIENITLTGADTVAATGNGGNNLLDGSQNSAANQLIGGLGDDTYILGNGDAVLEFSNEGLDTVVAGESYVAGNNIENVRLTGELAVSATGNASNNVLDGSQNTSANLLSGQEGDDTYVVGVGDLIDEAAGGGIDTVVSTIASYTLQANLENLTIEASAGSATGVGNSLDNLIIGNAFDNRLDGAQGADTMRGGSGNDVYVVDNIGDVIEDNSGQNTVEATISYALSEGVASLVLLGTDAIHGNGNALSNTLDGSQNSAANQLAGGAGNDRYIIGDGDTVVESANEGIDTIVTAQSTLLGDNIENLELRGQQDIDATGNALDNMLWGNDGSNVLDGAGGSDVMVGRGGDDTYIVNSAGDQVFEEAGGGIDTVNSAVSFVLGESFENLTLTGVDAINGTGNSRDNVLRGNSGANLLQGGQGNDTYHVGSGDVVVESASEGADTVISAVGRTLEGNVENLILVGDASIDGTGNESHNLLSGNAGNNRLDGLGGNDTMAGGLGDDIYVVDSGLDVVVESADAGIDTVESAETYVLGDNVENLILTGNGYASGTGNALDNSITGGIGGGSGVLDGGAGNDVITARGGAELHGGQGNDRLYGSAEYDLLFGDSGDDQLLGGEGNDYLDGGAGSDAMIGGAGDDNYLVDAESDTVSEEATGGNDVVNATANYQLAENVETLYLAGTGNIDGTGNSAANTIYGNAGNNRLDGRGGADQLSGGGGSDTYVVDNLADSIIDYQVDDNDTVESSIDWSLDSFQENLTLVGNLAINGTGNVFDNRIVGNSADNVLDGGTGNDTYFFSIGGGHDTIQEVADNTSGKNNVLRLGAGITPNDVILSRVGDDLEVAISGTDDRVTVRNFCLNNDVRNAENPVQQIVFADNTVWDLQLIQHLIFANHFPTGEVAISGSPIQNETLSVTNSLADVDGMGPISYQWQMSTDGVIWSDIGGETGTTLMLQEAHVGHQIRVSANYSDGLGLLESLASASTSVVGNVNDAPQGGLSILGDAVRNQVISISNNIADVDGIEQVSYRWQQSADGSAWVDISQANAESFTLTDGLVGQQIRVVASYVDGHGTPESVVSKAKLVLAAPNHAPVFLGGTGIPGVVVNDAGSTEDWLYGVDVQADGKYVVTGKTLDADGYPDFAIYRYNADGALDTTFNGTGKVTTALGAFNDEAYGVHVLQDGKILVGGFSSQGATDFALARYNADGSLDPSFGGDGKVTANINVYWDQAYSMAVQSDGKIVLAGMATGNPTNTQVLAVARFNDDGSLDTSFNGNGKALISAGYTNQYLQSVKLQEDGKIVTAGFGYNQGSGNYDLVLLRFNQNGTLDTSFNEDGIVTNDSGTSDIARSLAIQSDGKVLVFGTSVNGACIWRYNVNGSLDASFGTSGRVDVTVGSWSYGDSLTLDSEGKILISGYLNRSETGLDVAVARYLANGSLDTQFGDNGIATVATSTNVDSASALRLLQDGRILVVGGRYASDTDTDMIVARFSANGVLDESFGSASRIADQAAIKGTPFTFTLPSGSFADPDDGDSLVYSASLADGSALPGWLKFDNATLTFSGTPTAGAIGISELRVTATDMADQSASSNVFRLSVAFVNSAPGGTLSVAGIQRQYETLTAVSTLTDEDGLGPYTYQWQSSSGEDVWTDLSGMTSDQIVLSESVVGKQLRVKISYVDGFGSAESVTSVATSSVMNVNDAPLLVAPISDKIATQGVAFSAAVALNAFADPDAGDVLSYTASLEDGSPLPSWLTFDPVNRQFHGVPTDAGSLSVRIIATDSGGMTASDVFLITIEGLDKTLTGTAGADTLTGNIGNDTLSGLDGNDTLNGLDGNDYLDGGAGNDKMIGGAGDDVYIVGSASDIVTELSNGGSDTVRSSVTYTLAANVETLVLTGTTAINATGNALSNTLTGNSAKNTLDGGSGADVMSGGVGDDTYIVDNAGDVVIENANEGSDTIQSSVTYTLGMNQEKLTLTGSASINGTGNELANTLTGNAANNILDGGLGNDSLAGGAGNDTYIVSTGDTISEAASAGTDTVISDITWTLGSNLENLTLTGAAAINGTGNTLNNTLIGNSAANTLSGGTGADTMQGGAGDDTYVVDNAGDVVTEASNAGVDLVKSSVTYTLSGNVENLTLTGTTAINGVGNALNNILTGNSANNTLTGGAGNDTIDGGSGDDTMLGGQGDDTYYVNVATDVVTENASEGFDSVYSTVTLTLAANAEALFMNGTSAINGTGNALNNLVRGNTAANTLNGGTGNDVLEGGAGNDILTDTAGTALFNGGAGTDTLTGGAGAEIFLGGLGNDTYTTAGGNDIILFNKGDGQDTFAAGGTGSDIISLGGSINYADLTFSKSSNDLVLKLGGTDQITFKNWYASTPSKPVATLQVIAEAMADFAPGGSDPLLDQKVENFNFTSLVNAFDAARTANTGLTSWALTNALTSFQLAGSDTAALGGDLAYQYGKNGTLAGIGVTPALGALSDSKLGSTAQTLTPLSGLQTGTVRLS